MQKKYKFQSQLVLSTLLFLPFLLGVLFFAKAFAKADDTVSKKVYAQMLAETLKVQTTQPEKCFKDINIKDEATPAICALKKKKIFTGTKKTNFLPNSNVKWGFAINTLCKANKWISRKTFSSCLAYAKKNNMVSAASTAIKQQKTITLSELNFLLKVETTAGKQDDPIKEQAPSAAIPPPAQDSPNLSFTPVPEATIATNWFSNISLAAPMPNRFYLNEVYFLEGDLVNSSASEVFAFLCKDEQECNDSIDYVSETSGKHFVIPLYFEEAGNFQIGIIPGKSGQSRVENISVLPGSPDEPSGGKAPTSISVKFSTDKTTFHWNGEGILTRLVIFQGNQRKDYIFRQDIASFSPSPEDFASFNGGKAFWFVKKNAFLSPTQEINITMREFRKISPNITVKNMKEIFSSPGRFTFSGVGSVPASKKAAIVLADGRVKELEFSTADIPAGKEFTIETDLNSAGTYFFEINNLQGDALVNVPLYVGSAIPLLPDALTLNRADLVTGPLQDLTRARKELLELLNEDRKAYALSPLELSDELTKVAQAHSLDMANNNFFGHVNLLGLGPEDRRKNAKITTPIRENLGKAATLVLVEAGLMRSPLHRSAILDPTMQRVGLGIAKNAEGYYLVTQNFAVNTISGNDLPIFAHQLFESANVKRRDNSLPLFSEDATLRDAATAWSTKMASEGFFGIDDPQGKSILDAVRGAGIKSAVQIHIIQINDRFQLEVELSDQSAFKNASNRKLGIGLGTNDIGEFYMTTIYSP